ncbi:MAG TPA: hypothetical protein VH877_33825 [Polyangia bacterium]|nr:hypothetical protein [Polyangia bacterium]
MNRRQFLGSAAAAAVIATWPGWLRRAFAGTSPIEEEAAALAVLSEGYRRAQRAGKPLLVLVIPADGGQKYDRGRAFGEYLNHGSAEQLAPLALCEVACAEMAKLRRLAPAVGEGEPLMVLIETDRVPARVQRLDATLGEDREGDWRVVDDDPADPPPKKKETEEERWQRRYEARQRRADAAIARRIERIAALVREAVQPDLARLEERAARVRAHVQSVGSGVVTARFEQDLASGAEVSRAAVEEAPALVALAAARAQGARREALLGLLAHVVEARLRRVPPSGSRWAVSAGCGTRIEGETQQVMVACGMGHVPEKSRRFLYFFAKNDDL